MFTWIQQWPWHVRIWTTNTYIVEYIPVISWQKGWLYMSYNKIHTDKCSSNRRRLTKSLSSLLQWISQNALQADGAKGQWECYSAPLESTCFYLWWESLKANMKYVPLLPAFRFMEAIILRLYHCVTMLTIFTKWARFAHKHEMPNIARTKQHWNILLVFLGSWKSNKYNNIIRTMLRWNYVDYPTTDLQKRLIREN